ncbi:hypothetical protein BZARG_2250 [Bizionia argentinensis JUB59]|uniref:Uncharacterized protein n=2 Tax=Bizionia TaxID=283785 RepID=G2EGE2_9FLAO|nr:hypothetical protein BZARG_2250 [Bizionia argentinensis JUB59]
MNTHRTLPERLKDEITLKNHIKEVETRLLADTTKREATALLEKLESLADQIDHAHNLESLILFVNEDIAKFTRLPIQVSDRVMIDSSFSTRDLVRAMHSESNYYILVLNQDKVRLVEALNDRLVTEFKSPFPIENTLFFGKNKTQFDVASKKRSLMAEFFNQVDKEVNAIRKENPLPVLIVTVEENYHEYLKIADEKESIFTSFLNNSRIEEIDHVIVTEAWGIVEAHNIAKNVARKAELLKAVTENKFLSDTNEIRRAITEGRIQTLFIEKGLFQPAVMEDDEIRYVKEEDRTKTDVIDDIYDELIDLNMSFGGDVVFLPKGELSKFNGFGAITRY